jgi:type I restriction enzyme S subunit
MEIVNPDYLCYWLNSTPGIAVIDNICVELTRKRFSLADLHAIRFPLPPLREQAKIAEFLDDITKGIDAIRQRIRDGIARLQEYRTALISAAVTGQIDVRGEVSP